MWTNLPLAIRALRIRRGWRQVDLADAAQLSRALVSRLERGNLESTSIRGLDRVARALEATLVVELRWRGADLDRLIDRTHAALQDATAARLGRAGWQTWVEVAFNHFGDRGSCDLVAWHAATGTMLIVEVKSRIGNVQDTLRQLDVKVRVAAVLARQLGLPHPRAVARVLVIAEGHSSRLVVARHPSLFAGFEIRGRSALRWLRAPERDGTAGLLWFENSSNGHDGAANAVQRVRRHVSASSPTR